MKFNKVNYYRLTDKGKQLVADLYDTETFVDNICFGYPVWYNNVNRKYMHTKSFGSNNDYEYGSYTDIVVAFDRNRLTLSNSANGGMTWLLFDDKTPLNKRPTAERDVMCYTIQFVNDLIEQGVIHAPKR